MQIMRNAVSSGKLPTWIESTRAARHTMPHRQRPPCAPCAGLVDSGDYHFSHYSLAHADGGVCIDMTDGRVRFDWDFVPVLATPGAFATFGRRLHFRNGRHVDEPDRQIKVPPRRASAPRQC